MDRYEESKIPSRAHPAGTRRYPVVVNVKVPPCVAWPPAFLHTLLSPQLSDVSRSW
jgi:hypothetical protein